jgi:CRISPR-associated protein Cas4
VARGVTLLRALPVWSERLALSGKCDIVERHVDGTLVPVEYKKGRRRTFENDDAQLCAQALCLEEMLDSPVRKGAVFHAQSKRRRGVEFDFTRRRSTEQAIADLHLLVNSSTAGRRQARLRLLSEIKADEDSLRFYFLDEKAVERTEHHGTEKPTDLAEPLIL